MLRRLLALPVGRYFAPGIAACLYLAVEALTFRSYVGMEEFRDLWILQFLRQGQLPMRDFLYEYGPLGPFLLHGFLWPLPLEIFLLRVLLILVGLVTFGAAYALASHITPDRKSASVAALASAGVLTFPVYSYTHWLSVLSLLGSLIAWVRFRESGRLMWFLLATVLGFLTLLIRPIPTGLAFLIGVGFETLTRSMQPGAWHWKWVRAGALATGVAAISTAFVLIYSYLTQIPLFRWVALNFGRGIPFLTSDEQVLSLTLPRIDRVLVAYATQLAGGMQGGLLVQLNELVVFLNVVVGQLVDIAWIIVAGFVLWKAVRERSHPQRCPIVCPLLAGTAVALWPVYHNWVVATSYPDYGLQGKLWSLLGTFLMQPVVILGVALFSQIEETESPSKQWRKAVVYLSVLGLVLLPKIGGAPQKLDSLDLPVL